ncbi:HK97 family phage prohead protease [Weissella cibaria]|uniref:HK97 family phage prohead protease n=1 Tax=Weissella cibaria TaxID=137591 RepID=UPI0025531F82|nr:HK97 family phage prohead protease [Weissella cibaria]MDK9676799.1 HK97 family phage prohead protease [Weissella cibaria]
MIEIEQHHVDNGELEVRSSSDGKFVGQIAGYALKFGKPSISRGKFVEYIHAGAFNGVDLTEVLALFEHNYASLLGRVDAGTLSLNVDDVGLHFVLDIPDTTLGRDVYNNVKLGNLKGMSFSFHLAKGGDEWKQGEKPIRIINKIKSLEEISVVSVPAYEDTSVQVTRSLNAFFDEQNEQNYREKVRIYLGGSHG